MTFFDWVFDRTPTLTDPTPVIAAPAPQLPAKDSGDASSDFVSVEELEPVFVMIEYTDAAGDFSRRRITMRRIEHGPAGTTLCAFCHERRAPRRFRVDRISAFITEDGEIIEPNVFWNSIGIDPSEHSVSQNAVSIARALRDRFRPGLSVLVALGRCDGRLDPEEVAAMLWYVEKEANEVEIPWTPEAIDKLGMLLNTMRPSRESLCAYFMTVTTFRNSRRRRFAQAVREVAVADKVLDPAEIALIEQIARWEQGEDVPDVIMARFAPPTESEF